MANARSLGRVGLVGGRVDLWSVGEQDHEDPEVQQGNVEEEAGPGRRVAPEEGGALQREDVQAQIGLLEAAG